MSSIDRAGEAHRSLVDRDDWRAEQIDYTLREAAFKEGHRGSDPDTADDPGSAWVWWTIGILGVVTLILWYRSILFPAS